MLRVWLDRQLGSAGHALAKARLTELAADVAGPLRAAHADAEAHPPELVRYDPWGARVDRVETSAGWQAQRAAAARHAVVAVPYRPRRAAPGAPPPGVQHALLHLYGPESATFSCPVAMADGAAALLTRARRPGVRDRGCPGCLHRPGHAITSGQWMTESRAAPTWPARDRRPPRRRPWLLTGEKWFCSAADSAMAVALARPEGAGPGSRTLAPFLCLGTRRAIDGRPPRRTVHRLKDKLGTRALPTAEVGLADAVGIPLGDPPSRAWRGR